MRETVPGPSDPQSSPQPAPDSAPAEPERSNAVRLLEEIRERMERLEGNLSLRERRVARVERALREADARLATERARFAAEREAIEKGLPQQLRQREQQLEAAMRNQQELEKRLAAHLARERELVARIEKLTAERDQAAGFLEQARRELQEARRCQSELENQLKGLDRQRGEGEGLAATIPGTGIRPQTSEPSPALSSDLPGYRPLLCPVRRNLLLALPMVCLLIGVVAYWLYPRTYRIEGALTAPSDWADALAGFESDADNPAGAEWGAVAVYSEKSPPALVATLLVRDREDGLAKVNSHMEDLLRRIPVAASQPATQPAVQARRDQLQSELETVDARIATLTAELSRSSAISSGEAGQTPADPVKLLAGWRKTLAERKAVDQTVRELDVKLQRKPPELSEVQLTPEQINAAIAADARLQADSEVLHQREARLAEALRQIFDAARPAFTDMAQTADISEKYLEELIATPQDVDVAEALQVIRASLANCAKAATALAKTWQDERAAIDAGRISGGMAARYTSVDTAARQFVESTTNSLTLLQKSLDAISQGGEEPTKRLVLRSALAQKLQPVLDARETLLAVVRQITAGENVELTTLAQGVGGLHNQVQDRRARLEQNLRNQALAELRAAYDREMQELRARREELARKATEMDTAVVRSADEALALLGGSQAREAALTEMVELTRRRAELLADQTALDAEAAKIAAATARLGELKYSGAVATDVTSERARALAALGAGLAPAVLAGLIALFLWASRAMGSPSTLDSYVKALSNNSQPQLTKTETKDAQPRR